MPQHPVLMGMVKPPASGDTINIHEAGLVCYVDAGLSSSYSGSGLTWTDISTESNDHTWATTAPSHTSGSAGYFDFTETAGEDTSGGTTNLTTGAGSWTVECWFNPDSITTYTGLWWMGTNTGEQGVLCGIYDSGDVYVETSGGGFYGHGLGSAGTWRSVVVTYDGTDLTLFVDNVSRGTVTVTLSLTFGTFVIGNNVKWTERMNGKIAMVAVYDDELTSGERGTNYTEFGVRY